MTIVNEELLKQIKDSWWRFIKEDKLDKNINPLVAESWKRCKKLNVDPYGGNGYRIPQKEMDKIISNNKELLRIAKPIMDNLDSLILGSGFILVLTDKNGVILHLIGEKEIKEKGKKLLFQPGSLWSEEKVGTNAIGTCIMERKPIQTVGAEHYCETHHLWTCSAAPIFDSHKNIIGVIDMSGESLSAHKHTLGIVLAAAYSIESQLNLIQLYALIDATVENIMDGSIIIDNNYSITAVNKSAEKILGLSKGEMISTDARAFTGQDLFTQETDGRKSIIWDFSLGNANITCIVRVIPISLENNIGNLILFRELRSIQDTVNIITGNNAIYTFQDIVTQDEKMSKSIKEAQKFSRSKGTILIEGESGTGKELFAHSIHNFSNYNKGPFVTINCASLPKELVESELFGYEKGAFTGALNQGKIGKFELANEGTIFLDEIGEMPLDLQAKLLRVLDDYVITRIGGKTPKKLNVRFIVATNRNLHNEVKKKNFREDLYYRLNVFKVTIPPLRERKGDVILLFNYFLQKLNKGNRNKKVLSEDFINCFDNYQWHGNVRELENIIERAYYLCEDVKIGKEYLPDEILNRDIINMDSIYSDLKVQEKVLIKNALDKAEGHVIMASQIIGYSKSKMYRKIKDYRINLKNYK